MRRPHADEAAPYYWSYINCTQGDDVVRILEEQREEAVGLLRGISEEKSLYRYAPEKWSIRQLLNHVNDTERVFTYRALWFARGYEAPLPSFDQEVAVKTSNAEALPWASHIEEFQRIRLATIALFRNLPAEAWDRWGVASEKRFTVRAMAFITAGHLCHHIKVLRENYL